MFDTLESEDIEIKQISNQNEKELISSLRLNALPNWFGIRESTQEYIEQSCHMPFFVAFDNKKSVGFVALKVNSEFTAEIYVMGVLPEDHNRGIGKTLFSEILQWAKDNGFQFLQVKTLDESHSDPYYARTRKFYRAIGFKPFEILPELWGKGNPCLIMVQHID